MIAQVYEKEIRTICMLAVASCRLPVMGMAALARRSTLPKAHCPRKAQLTPEAQEDELAELVRRLREEFVFDPAIDPDMEAW